MTFLIFIDKNERSDNECIINLNNIDHIIKTKTGISISVNDNIYHIKSNDKDNIFDYIISKLNNGEKIIDIRI